MTKLEQLRKNRKDLTEEILAFVPTRDIKLVRLQLDRLHNLGGLETLERLSYEPKSN